MANAAPSARPPVPILILPGINDSGPAHWQSLWEASIPGARRVLQNDWDNPDCALWVAALARVVNEAQSGQGEGERAGAVLAAHSLGCLLVAHAAAGPSREALARNVRGALLVAPPDPDAISFPTDIARGFDPLPLAPLPFPSVLVASRDDPYADFAFSRRVAAAWGSELVDAGARGHLNAESGLGDWPDGRRLLDRLIAARR
jgi:predicted alpha/beta hydrolase family esterase